jgi:uncharacterized protein YndB with AHSA1/START domain
LAASPNKNLSIWLGISLFLFSLATQSADLRDVNIEREDAHYRLTSETYLEVSREALYAVLTDFEKFQKFTSAIVESRNTEPDETGRPGFYARMEGCVLLFCKTFIRTGYLTLKPIAEIVAVSIPEESDFVFSRERWQLTEEGKGTVMKYEFEMIPAFWVPPVIGPFYIQRALRGGAERAVDRIEALAQAEENGK